MSTKISHQTGEPFPLKDINVFISASIPTQLVGSPKTQEMYAALSLLVRQIASKGGGIVFGGHPNITPLIHRAARDLQREKFLHLYQLNKFRDKAPKEVADENVFHDVVWVGETNEDIDSGLGKMRDMMAEASQAAIFIGGKLSDSLTKIAGIRDEYQRFTALKPNGPVYLLGFMEGETMNLIRELEKENRRENNTLTPRELEYIHHSSHVDLAVSLVMSDLTKFFKRP